jgi:hypothetical protein
MLDVNKIEVLISTFSIFIYVDRTNLHIQKLVHPKNSVVFDMKLQEVIDLSPIFLDHDFTPYRHVNLS